MMRRSRSTISRFAKKFIHQTLQSIKSFVFSIRHHQRLPKKPNYFRPFVSSCMGLSSHDDDYRDIFEKLYNELQTSEEYSYQKRKKTDDGKKDVELTLISSSSSCSSCPRDQQGKKSTEVSQSLDVKNQNSCEDEGDDFLVEKKLKELMKMKEMTNVDHILDVEEILHYYSRLTCPAYLRIVDKFFMEIYSEFFNSVNQQY